jgi:hypothetical protein
MQVDVTDGLTVLENRVALTVRYADLSPRVVLRRVFTV